MADPFDVDSTRRQIRRHDIFKIQVLDLVHDALSLPWRNIAMDFSHPKTIGCQIAMEFICPRLGIDKNHGQIRLHELGHLQNLGILVPSLGRNQPVFDGIGNDGLGLDLLNDWVG